MCITLFVGKTRGDRWATVTRSYRYVRIWPRSGGGSRDLSCSNQGVKFRCASLQGSDSAGHTAPARKRGIENKQHRIQAPWQNHQHKEEQEKKHEQGQVQPWFQQLLKGGKGRIKREFLSTSVTDHPSSLFTSAPEVFFRSPPPPSLELSLPFTSSCPITMFALLCHTEKTKPLDGKLSHWLKQTVEIGSFPEWMVLYIPDLWQWANETQQNRWTIRQGQEDCVFRDLSYMLPPSHFPFQHDS